MKLTLHIGMPKAGSTSIQHSLHKARKKILKYGCLYPDTLYIHARHHWLQPLVYTDPNRSPSVVARMGFSNEEAKRQALEEWDFFQKQLEPNRPDHLILSSEVLFAKYSEEEIARAKKFLPTLTDDIQVLAYVRSPVKRYISMVQQGLKSSSNIAQPGGTHTAKVLESYRSIYGRDVQTRIFEKSKLSKQDVVADFLEWANLPIPYEKLRKMQSNESVSAEGMAILQELSPPVGPKNMDELMLKRLRFRAVLLADQEIESPTKPELKAEIADYITAQCSELPLLRDRYGIEFDDIDYSLVQEKPERTLKVTKIDQLCSYNQERKEAVLEKAHENLVKMIKRAERKNKHDDTGGAEKNGILVSIKELFSSSSS